MKLQIATATALLGLFSGMAEAAVFSKAAKFASLISSSATNLPSGNYVIQNVQSKKYIAFSRARGVPDIVLSNSGSTVRLSNLGGRKLAIGLDRYCFSSQWNAARGINQADTLYRCCKSATKTCDNGSDEGPLRNAKQQHYFVASKSSAVRITSQAVQRRDLSEDEVTPFDERDLLSDEESDGEVALDKRASKKKKFVGTFNIVTVDHILDMKTQAVSGKLMVAAGRQLSPTLPILNSNDKSQQWNVYRLV